MKKENKSQGKSAQINTNPEIAIFAGGCFWCMQPPYDDLPGVISTTVGYTGGRTTNPTYEEVSTGETGHVEAVRIEFDPAIISYRELLDVFWRNIDPTNPLGQFADYGSQYKTTIFYLDENQKKIAIQTKKSLEESGKFSKPIVTGILPAKEFYPAEMHHQEFYRKNPFRYKSYKVGSGRAGFLKQHWSGEE
jgi:peptide methionine sulfoxide reductase msrA/msrB